MDEKLILVKPKYYESITIEARAHYDSNIDQGVCEIDNIMIAKDDLYELFLLCKKVEDEYLKI